MNNMFVYRGMLVKFDKLIGWFIYDTNGNRFDFDDIDFCIKQRRYFFKGDDPLSYLYPIQKLPEVESNFERPPF